MSSNAKIKGYTFERKIADLFSKAWGVIFGRIPGSGNMSWKGDIQPVELKEAAKNPFCIECKNQLRLSTLTWWTQTIEQADPIKKIPLLVFKISSKDDVVMLRLKDFLKIVESPF